MDRAEQGDDERQGYVLDCSSCYAPGRMETRKKYCMEKRSNSAQQDDMTASIFQSNVGTDLSTMGIRWTVVQNILV